MIDHLHHRFGWPLGVLKLLWPLLWVLSLLFTVVVKLKNWRWNKFPPELPKAPLIISVGNLSSGGTGKTPMGLAILRWLDKKGLRAEVVLRGYGARAGLSDEAELYRKAIGPNRVHQEPDRVLALEKMVSEEADVVILDDAFQHRRAPRHVDLVLWDLSAPKSECQVLPLGMLREPISSVGRADAVLLTRSDRVDQAEREKAEARLRGRGYAVEYFMASSKPVGLREWPSGQPLRVEEDCFLVSGIGRPQAFLETAEDMGLRVVGSHWFGDHHAYSEDDISMVWDLADQAGAKRIVVTSKDIVKWKGRRPVCVLEIETCVQEEFWAWLGSKVGVSHV